MLSKEIQITILCYFMSSHNRVMIADDKNNFILSKVKTNVRFFSKLIIQISHMESLKENKQLRLLG